MVFPANYAREGGEQEGAICSGLHNVPPMKLVNGSHRPIEVVLKNISPGTGTANTVLCSLFTHQNSVHGIVWRGHASTMRS